MTSCRVLMERVKSSSNIIARIIYFEFEAQKDLSRIQFEWNTGKLEYYLYFFSISLEIKLNIKVKLV